jgi:hypothetical protein
LALWRSGGSLIPWSTQNPRKIAECFGHLVWTYVQELSWQSIFVRRDKGSVIGHAALLAVMRRPGKVPEPIVFSNSGGNVGFYKNPSIPFVPGDTSKFPNRAPYKSQPLKPPIVACFHVSETLTAHVGDGHWEAMPDFRKRVRQRKDPTVQKKVVMGREAESLFESLQKVKKATEPFGRGARGGPKDYGLNTTWVRRIKDGGEPKTMTKYQIGSGQYEIHGGCGNAVASVLQACGLVDLIPRDRIQFEFEISLNDFKGIVLPVIIGAEGFSDDGSALDRDLIGELERVPTTWGSGYAVRFIDPNYWYELLLPKNDALVAEFKAEAGV